jgi:general secretion pathway protein M
MNAWTRRALLIPISVLLCVIAMSFAFATRLYHRYQADLSTIEPRIERLSGVVEAGVNIQTNLQLAAQTLEPWLHPSSVGVQTEVQQRLRQLIDGSGLTTVALQAAEPDSSLTLPRLRISATLSGSWSSMLRAMQALQQHRPAFWVQSVSVLREGRDAPSESQLVRLVLQIDAPLSKGGAP